MIPADEILIEGQVAPKGADWLKVLEAFLKVPAEMPSSAHHHLVYNRVWQMAGYIYQCRCGLLISILKGKEIE